MKTLIEQVKYDIKTLCIIYTRFRRVNRAASRRNIEFVFFFHPGENNKKRNGREENVTTSFSENNNDSLPI